MLVIKRRIGEGIQIGDDIIVKVTESKEGYLKIAIDAPKEVNIRRCEVEDNPKLHKNK